ncbi:hypothetical protein [Candidatus Leptofilum sp.]|uniref:hypothetical protein n=1 Tax=Candidatus Leptofilum sp. TaxID=3241576 RepID=UPI003B58DAEA
MDSREAEAQLKLIEQAQAAQQVVGRSETGWLFLIWGLVWLIGFLTSQFAPTDWLIWAWLLLCSVGAGLSAAVGLRLGQQVQYTQTGPKLGLFYTVFFSFCVLWLWLARPESWQETAVLAISFLGFAVVVNGILLKVRLFMLLGLIGTGLAVAVYLLLPAQFGLIVGLAGGGSMIAAGLRLLMRRQRE